jgi:tetratricopeptide (TPR) repeat protein
MAKVSLRSYNSEIDQLIDNNQLDEAIAHCIHILEIYPKLVDTYRLLGKAFLERQRYNDAADMFLRVLAIFPDDFVAHIGISIVREELSELNLAVFHMERAFEVQPTNTAIQEELKRLYGKRDGVAPTKIRLTHPALARLYSKGDLNQQALGELSVAIADTPSRPDILAQLAELYTKEGLTSEAIETCIKLIEHLSYCYGALNVLTRLLPGTPLAQDVSIYQARINELDPYFEFKVNYNDDASDVPEDAILIEPLVWSPDSELMVNKSDWASSLGLKLVEPQRIDLSLAQKKAPVASYTVDETPTVPRPRGAALPISTKPVPVSSNEPEASKASEPAPSSELPEWMKSAGWSKSSDTPDIESSGLNNEPASTKSTKSPSMETPGMPPISKKQRVTDHLPELQPEMGSKKPPEDTDSLEPAKSISPESIPSWVRSIAPSDIPAAASEAGSGSEDISEKAIDDAFSSLFPSNTPPVSKQEEIPSPTTVYNTIESVQPGLKPDVSVSSPLTDDIVQPVSDSDSTFSLDALRKEMDMVPDMNNGVEFTDTSDKKGFIPSDNDDALEDLRKSFNTEELRLQGTPLPEEEPFDEPVLSQEEPSVNAATSQDEQNTEADFPTEKLKKKKILPLEESVEKPVKSQEEPKAEVVLPPEESAEEVIAKPKVIEGEIPVWLQNLGDEQASPLSHQTEATSEELPAWLRDFEHKIDNQPETTKETSSETDKTIEQSAETINWRANLPEVKDSKFHTQELTPIPGLDLTSKPDQYEIVDESKQEKSTPVEQPVPSPVTAAEFTSEPTTPPFSGGDKTVIAPPVSKEEAVDDERPAWLSKLIGIDDVETPAPEKTIKPSPETPPTSKASEDMEEIAGAMQAAWMVDMLSGKDSTGAPPSETVLTPEESSSPSVQAAAPDISLPTSQVEPESATSVEPVTPSAEPTSPTIPPEGISSTIEGVSDLGKIIDGIQTGSEPIPVKAEPTYPTIPPVGISSTAEGVSDLGKIIDGIQTGSEPIPVEAEPTHPTIPPEGISSTAEGVSDLGKIIDGIQTGSAPIPVETEPIIPEVEEISEEPSKPKPGHVEGVSDTISVVDEIQTERVQAPTEPVPAIPAAQVTPERLPEIESVDTEGVPDLSKIIEGLQAAWMSEHVEDGETKHTGSLMDELSPSIDSGSSETIIVDRSGPKPSKSRADSSKPVAETEPPQSVSEQKPAEPEIQIAPIQQVAQPEEPISKPKIVEQKAPTRPAKQSQPVMVIPAEDILENARAAFSHGVLDESIDRYVELITHNHLVESVIEDLETMTSAQPDQSDVWQALGDAYTRRNKLDQALSAYLKAEALLK